jgi:Xaa-Pro aminopeptidase
MIKQLFDWMGNGSLLRRAGLLVIALGGPLSLPSVAQPVFRDSFPPEEFAARRARVFEKIGDGIAILEGTTERPGEQPFRQSNQFFYLTGVSEPRAIALLDGRTKETLLFLLPQVATDTDSKYGPGAIYPGEDSARKMLVSKALARDELPAILAKMTESGRTIYTPFRPEVLGSASSYDSRLLAKLNREDPWDGRSDRVDMFRLKLMSLAPASQILDLDPIVDQLRAIKSEREIAVIREATRIADRGILRAMHAAKAGLYEYQLQAESDYEFKHDGAYGPAYFALVATGKNTWYTHYHYNTAKLQIGELVQYDYAPDYRNYSSDVTRVFPVSGKFSPHQREYYGVYLRLYQAILSSIRVHETAEAIAERAAQKMDAILAAYEFRDPATRSAVQNFIDTYRGKKPAHLGHAVGLEVHDVYGTYATLEPGMVFTIEPMLRLPAEHVAVRLEDMLLITEQGYESLSGSVPVEIADIEKFMARPLPSDLR